MGAGADVVDDDWLVGEDIFVFGGHSARGGPGLVVGRVRELGGVTSFDGRERGAATRRRRRGQTERFPDQRHQLHS